MSLAVLRIEVKRTSSPVFLQIEVVDVTESLIKILHAVLIVFFTREDQMTEQRSYVLI